MNAARRARFFARARLRSVGAALKMRVPFHDARRRSSHPTVFAGAKDAPRETRSAHA
jgi:hypothetical protein